MILLNEYIFVIIALIIVSAILPLLRNIIENRSHKIRTDCLMLANENDWISIEEIASISGTSTGKARRFIAYGIEQGIIFGQIENDMFVRSRYQDPNSVRLGWTNEDD